MIMGIVGSEAAKFTPETEAKAKACIRTLLTAPGVTGVSSGACHLGGIDIWAEEIAIKLGLELFIYPPEKLEWTFYKKRNLQIVAKSDVVHCITVRRLPPEYKGMRFDFCYHCLSGSRHVKSGGCWTAKQASLRAGKQAFWHVIE